mmetsp:Transcript_118680/g.361016  ORF Transcript_118680/g.361016 Transcript_118680/m.361016 type:complete len:625 (-) Transcript_118680:92-1966(-)
MALRFCVLCVASSLLAVPASASEEPPEPDFTPSALAADDACVVDGDGQCALSALQLRGGKMLGGQAESPGSAAGTSAEDVAAESARQSDAQSPSDVALAASASHAPVHFAMFRAMHHTDLNYSFANVDMASIEGILNYLHTDVVAEHAGDYAGYSRVIRVSARVNEIDAIVKVNTMVKNPDSLLDSPAAEFVDFAPSAHFIEGEATGPQYNWNHGDIVGAQRADDPRYPTLDPFYRFSLSGYCPNLKFPQKEQGARAAERAHAAAENTAASHGRRRRSTPKCMTYADTGNLRPLYGQVLKGGLCPNGTSPGATPTGMPGCVYTYQPPRAILRLDELVGITAEDCGHRPCRNWEDFRRHCTNRHYRQKFNYAANRRRYGTHLRSPVCVEYDIHKACARSCSSRACQQVPPDEREIGLPFWKGRCSALHNARRAERLAQAFNISGATTAHRLMAGMPGETCVTSASPTMCRPTPNTGGMYCTRAWGGVCQPCYIPNTVEVFPNASSTPVCPWRVLTERGDYSDPALHPNCTSNLPRDLCCLYRGTCNATFASDPATLTEDGFAFVASKQDTGAMTEFLVRAAQDALAVNVTDTESLSVFAYWQWGLAPVTGASYADTVERMRGHVH